MHRRPAIAAGQRENANEIKPGQQYAAPLQN
jgi:hypothetical protein